MTTLASNWKCGIFTAYSEHACYLSALSNQMHISVRLAFCSKLIKKWSKYNSCSGAETVHEIVCILNMLMSLMLLSLSEPCIFFVRVLVCSWPLHLQRITKQHDLEATTPMYQQCLMVLLALNILGLSCLVNLYLIVISLVSCSPF